MASEIKKHILNDTLEILVIPNSSKNEIIIKNGVKVYVTAPPDKNKANIAVIKLLSKLTNGKARIIKGLKSRKKIIEFY